MKTRSLIFKYMTMMVFGMALIFTTACNDDNDMGTCSDGIQNQDETGVDCGGVCDACPTCSDGIQNQDETGVDCGGVCDPCLIGVMGEWQSSGTNVAPLLVNLFATDSIYAEFRTNMTYTVEQYDTTGAVLVLEGTYQQAESSVDGIWTITVNQTSPAQLTSEGIFALEMDDSVMRYEIVQTQPDIQAVPPTPEGGFGSTNGGLFGTANVQVYERVE